MFTRLAPQYDRMNRFMSAGRDGRWRQQAVAAALADFPRGERGAVRVLDIGAGTGDLAEAFRRAGVGRVVALDVSGEMLRRARGKYGAEIEWLQGDGQRLPFADHQFDAVASAFVLRNLPQLEASLAEMVRVLKPGGRLVALDITHPPENVWGKVLRFGFEEVVTRAAGRLSGDREAYRYLPNSLEGYPTASELAAMLEQAGAGEVSFERFSLGAVALHQGRKV